MTDLPAIIEALIAAIAGSVEIDQWAIVGLVSISSSICVLVTGIKRVALLIAPDLDLTPWWRLALRALAVLLGVAAVLAWLGVGVVELALGIMAGMASEVVYRYVMRWIETRIAMLLGVL